MNAGFPAPYSMRFPTMQTAEGKIRAGLDVSAEGPVWGLSDEKQKTRAGLGVDKDGQVFSLLGEPEKTRTTLS